MKAYMDVDVQYEVNGLRILRETREFLIKAAL